MDNVMLDIETLGTSQQAPVISIGACYFTLGNPDQECGDFYRHIDWSDAIKGREVSGETLKWWMVQSDSARDAVVQQGSTVREALMDLAEWLGDNSIVWGNGATFDIAILENLYNQYEIPTPWKFYNVRDVRTVVAIAEDIASKDDVPFTGTPHHALYDAIHQAKYVSHLWSAVRDV